MSINILTLTILNLHFKFRSVHSSCTIFDSFVPFNIPMLLASIVMALKGCLIILSVSQDVISIRYLVHFDATHTSR